MQALPRTLTLPSTRARNFLAPPPGRPSKSVNFLSEKITKFAISVRVHFRHLCHFPGLGCISCEKRGYLTDPAQAPAPWKPGERGQAPRSQDRTTESDRSRSAGRRCDTAPWLCGRGPMPSCGPSATVLICCSNSAALPAHLLALVRPATGKE